MYLDENNLTREINTNSTSEVNINNINAREPRSTVRNILSPVLINETTTYEEYNSEDFWEVEFFF